MLAYSYRFHVLLLILSIIEMGLFTFWHKVFGPHTLPFLFFGLQLSVGLLPLIFFKKLISSKNNQSENITSKSWIYFSKNNNKQNKTLTIFLFLAIVVISLIITHSINSTSIKPSDSDIIPQIQVFCRRAWAGEYPYSKINEFGYEMTANYLPTQWIPYLPSEIFTFDPRYISLIVFVFSYSCFFITIARSTISIFFKIALIALPIIFVSAVHDHNPRVWTISVEQLILSYYLLLGVSLTTNSRIFQSMTIVLCLMSRFSLIFWLPLYVVILWTKEGRFRTLSFCMWIFVSCLLLYGPFLLYDTHIFFNSQAYYDLASVGEWKSGDKPSHLYNGLGFAIFFFEKGGDMLTQVTLLKKTMVILTTIVTLILGLVWIKVKDKMDISLFAICSLKISLTFFYAFIQIPYPYLYVTPFALSWIVLYAFCKSSHPPLSSAI